MYMYVVAGRSRISTASSQQTLYTLQLLGCLQVEIQRQDGEYSNCTNEGERTSTGKHEYYPGNYTQKVTFDILCSLVLPLFPHFMLFILCRSNIHVDRQSC